MVGGQIAADCQHEAADDQHHEVAPDESGLVVFVGRRCHGVVDFTGLLFRRLRRQTNVGEASAPYGGQDIHDGLILRGAVSTDDDGRVGRGGLDGFQLAGKFIQRDGGGVEFDVTLVVHRDGLHLRTFNGLGSGGAAARQLDLHALHSSGGHDDEDQQQHQVEVHHWRDVDVIVRFAVGLHGGVRLLLVVFRHLGDELVDEGLHVGDDILDP